MDRVRWLTVSLALLLPVSLVHAQRSGAARQPGPAAGVKKKSPVKPVATLQGFEEWVTSVAFSPDGKQLAAGSYGGVRRWAASTRKELPKLKVKSGYVRDLAYSPDGKLLAAGHYQRTSLFDTGTGKRVAELKGQRGQVTGVAYSPDGKRLATSSEDETVHVWNVADGKIVKVFADHTYPVQGVAFSPDGKLIASAAGDETRVTKPGEVIVRDSVSGKPIATWRDHKKAATGVAFSPDGRFVVTTSYDEKVNVYELGTNKPLGFFGGHGRPTTAAAFTPDGRIVATSSGGRAKGKNEVKLWDRASGEEFATISEHAGRVNDVSISPDGRSLLTASHDKTVRLWDISAVGKPAKAAVAAADSPKKSADAGKLKAGIIGLDTSHVLAFTRLLNDPKAPPELANCRVVAAYPKGSPDIESSTKRVPAYTKQMKELGVEIVDSISELIKRVDVVLLETNDGRPHLEQILPVLKAGKPVFIDKPIAGSLADAVAIFEAARKYKVPIFSSSSLRYGKGSQAVRGGSIGEVKRCETTSPCSIEKTHPDLFWYGIHGVEPLFTIMGSGCVSVTRVHTEGNDVAVGVWNNGRIGTFRGIRQGRRGYGSTVFGTKGIVPGGTFDGYEPLIVEIVKFFKTGKPPVSEAETLEIFAFMEAADESKRQGGRPVTLQSVMKKAQQAADKSHQ